MAQVALPGDSLTSGFARTDCRQAIEVAAMRWLGWRSDSTIASRWSDSKQQRTRFPCIWGAQRRGRVSLSRGRSTLARQRGQRADTRSGGLSWSKRGAGQTRW